MFADVFDPDITVMSKHVSTIIPAYQFIPHTALPNTVLRTDDKRAVNLSNIQSLCDLKQTLTSEF